MKITGMLLTTLLRRRPCLPGLLALAVALQGCTLPASRPSPGREIPGTSPEETLAGARDLYEKRRYRMAIEELAPLSAGHGDTARSARDLLNASYLGLGRALEGEGDYPGALRSYRRADRGYRGVRQAIADLERRMEEESEARYLSGVQFFVNQELDSAIAEWEKALAINPDHSRAARDREKALRLREELDKARDP